MEIYFKQASKNSIQTVIQRRSNVGSLAPSDSFSAEPSEIPPPPGTDKSSPNFFQQWQCEIIFWHSIYRDNIIYTFEYTHNIMYKDVYSMIYHNIHDKILANITNILLTFHCQGAITNLDHYLHPAHQGPLCERKMPVSKTHRLIYRICCFTMQISLFDFQHMVTPLRVP